MSKALLWYLFLELPLSLVLVGAVFFTAIHHRDTFFPPKPVNHPPNYCITSDAFTGMLVPCHIGWRTWETWIKDGDEI